MPDGQLPFHFHMGRQLEWVWKTGGTRSVAGMAFAIPSEPPKLVAGIEKAAFLAVLRLMPRALTGLPHPTAIFLQWAYFTLP